jgi:hypothetical protein
MFQIHEFNFQHNLKIGRLKIRDNYIFSALDHYLESFHHGLDLVDLQFIQLAMGNAAPEDDDPLRSALVGVMILHQAGCRFKKKNQSDFRKHEGTKFIKKVSIEVHLKKFIRNLRIMKIENEEKNRNLGEKKQLKFRMLHS